MGIYRTSITLLLFSLVPLFSSQTIDPFEEDMLNIFYDEFVCDEKDIIETVHLGGPCTGPRHTGGGTPPPPPTACGALQPVPSIAPMNVPNVNVGYIPFLFVNNTGLLDSEVYVLIYGYPVVGNVVQSGLEYVGFGAQPGPVSVLGTYVPVTGVNTPASSTYSYQLSNIPLTGGQRILYIPYLASGIILFSFNSALSLTSSPGSIAVPIATDPTDSSYNIVYTGMELTFYPPGFEIDSKVQNQFTVDFTCVDYFGSPVYFNVHNDTSSPQDQPSGVYQSRHYTLCSLQNVLSTAAAGNARTNWDGLVLKNGSQILRIASPGYSMTNAGGTFDAQYLDNASAYGFSWANDVWTGPDAYYSKTGKNNALSVTISGASGTANYTGQVNSSQEFVFSTNQALFNKEVFTVPWVNVGSHDPSIQGTTAGIMRTGVVLPGMTYTSTIQTTPIDLSTSPGSAPAGVMDRATKLTKCFCSAIVVGLLPGTISSFSTTSFGPNVIANYYTVSASLTAPGGSTGPWFDLYSKGLLGNTQESHNAVYSYTYDDYLYGDSNIIVAPSIATVDSSTNVTVVLGPYSDN